MSDFNQGWKSWDALPNLGDHWKCYLNFNNGKKKSKRHNYTGRLFPRVNFLGDVKDN